MSEPRPNFAEGVASKVLEACRRDDPECRITYVGRDERGGTRVRVRSGNGASAHSLQRTLQTLLPFSSVSTNEDVLDGSASAEVCILNPEDEYAKAQELMRSSRSQRALNAATVAFAVLGVSMWLSAILGALAGDI